MLCSSPISTSMLLYTETRDISDTGISIPHITIRVKRPSVLSDTVLPPVLGPVITSVSYSSPIAISVATTFLGSISGWRAFFK